MRRFAAVTVTALLSAAALTTGAGAEAAQASDGFTVHVLGGLHLKRVDATSGQTQVTYLLCTSTSSGDAEPVIHGLGGLKDATSACEELAAVHGNLDALSVHPTWLAPAVVAPVEARAAGTWEGAKVVWDHKYTNGGWLAKATGDVFAF